MTNLVIYMIIKISALHSLAHIVRSFFVQFINELWIDLDLIFFSNRFASKTANIINLMRY